MIPALKNALLTVVVSALAASCASDGVTQATNPTGTPSDRVLPTGPNATRTGTSSAAPVSNIPAGAKYTTVCQVFSGPGHILLAKNAKDKLIRESALPAFHVVSTEDSSSLCYGYYKEVRSDMDAVEAQRAAADRAKLTALKLGDAPRFGATRYVALDTPDPTAVPEWNLANSTGYWSLVIAGYNDPVTRKTEAVEAVRGARALGYEAYYYHGPSVSQVCIGSFPKESLRAQDDSRAQTKDSETKPMIISTVQLSPEERAAIKAQNPDKEIRSPVIEVQDPKLLAAWKEFRDYALNGNVDMMEADSKVTRKKVMVPKPSFLVEIPTIQKGYVPTDERARYDEARPDLPAVPTRQPATGGQLRGINDGPRR